ncbi:hypothetical protein Tco_1323742, partial [Tanacetum coccineum]
TFPSDMSSGNMCHGGTNYLTEKYVGPTVLLGIVAGERIPSERSPATSRQGKVTGMILVTTPLAGWCLGPRIPLVVVTTTTTHIILGSVSDIQFLCLCKHANGAGKGAVAERETTSFVSRAQEPVTSVFSF